MNAWKLVLLIVALLTLDGVIARGKERETGITGVWATDCVTGPTLPKELLRLLTEGQGPNPSCRSGALGMKLKSDVKTGKLSGAVYFFIMDKKVKIEGGRFEDSEFFFRTKVEIDHRVIENAWSGTLLDDNVLHVKLSNPVTQTGAPPLVFHRGKSGR